MRYPVMKKIAVLCLLSLTLCYAFKATNTITKSQITFEIKNLGINTHGIIDGLKADFHIDPANPVASMINASVETNTINTDNDMRDKHLKSDDFFDVEKYPVITLKSTAIKHKSGDSYTGTFNLNIKNKTKAVEIPFTYIVTADKVAFKCLFKINRLDYGIGSNSFTMGDQVTISINAEAAK